MPIGFELDGIAFTPDTLAGHPEHAALLGQVVTSFSLVEGVIGGIYGLLRHQEIDAALEDLKALSTNAKRVQAVRQAIATHPTLSADPENDLLMKAVLSYAEARNKIAHGIWGSRSDQADIVYRLPVKKWINFAGGLVAGWTSGTAMDQIDALAGLVEEYSVSDLHALQLEGVDLLERVFKLFNELAMDAALVDGLVQT
jgi:hypothetical protein